MEADKRNENLQKFWSQVIMERVNIAKNEIMQSQKKTVTIVLIATAFTVINLGVLILHGDKQHHCQPLHRIRHRHTDM